MTNSSPFSVPLAEQYALAERMVELFREPMTVTGWVRETLRLIREGER